MEQCSNSCLLLSESFCNLLQRKQPKHFICNIVHLKRIFFYTSATCGISQSCSRTCMNVFVSTAMQQICINNLAHNMEKANESLGMEGFLAMSKINFWTTFTSLGSIFIIFFMYEKFFDLVFDLSEQLLPQTLRILHIYFWLTQLHILNCAFNYVTNNVQSFLSFYLFVQ